LIQLLKQQLVVCQKTIDVPITPGVPVRPGVPTRPGVPIRPGLPNRSGVAIPPAIPVRPTSCQNIKRKLLRQIKHFASRLCYYKKTAKRLKFQLKQLLVSNLSPTSLQTSKQLPAVPIPMMHVMKSLTPSMPLSPFQHVSSSVDLTRASFIKSFQQVYKNTQEALTHCMDAILAQTLITQSQINAKCNNCHQFIKDRELAENQIKFLNSIIVDIQKKNEEQKARIEILESGYSPAMADELKLIGTSHQRQPPPRVYCDICEEFDLHETEDCPAQNTDVVPSNGQHGHKHVGDRPYCEICEAFGHATEDCQEDETF
jgi:hypothetical protein